MKTCSKCGVAKSANDFYLTSNKVPEGSCKLCRAAMRSDRMAGVVSSYKKKPPYLGKRFGRLIVLLDDIYLEGKHACFCACSCGGFIVTKRSNLTRVKPSCGCQYRESKQGKPVQIKHNLSRDPIYKIWTGMKQRCTNQKIKSYQNYGGRGIYIADEWLDFEVFARDMLPRPSNKHTLERKDNYGPYSVANCVWATRSEQNRNRRVNVVIEIDGVSMILMDWCKKYGIGFSTVHDRIHKQGMSPRDAITTPAIDKRLADETVRRIRSAVGTSSSIAADYGINQSTVSRIKSYDAYSHVKDN